MSAACHMQRTEVSCQMWQKCWRNRAVILLWVGAYWGAPDVCKERLHLMPERMPQGRGRGGDLTEQWNELHLRHFTRSKLRTHSPFNSIRVPSRLLFLFSYGTIGKQATQNHVACDKGQGFLQLVLAWEVTVVAEIWMRQSWGHWNKVT